MFTFGAVQFVPRNGMSFALQHETTYQGNACVSLKVMLIDEDAQRAASLKATLVAEGYEVISVLCETGLLPEALKAAKPDLIIIDFDSPGRDSLEHLTHFNRDCGYPVVLCAAEVTAGMMRAAIDAGVSAYVSRGLSGRQIAPALDLALARFREYRNLQRELNEAKDRLADRKLIDRAKGILMRRQNIDEEQAYATLRQLAMRRQLRMGDAARLLLDASEVLT
jgi:two-component system, response regulator / RNA-binding antiterminator